MFTPFLDSSSDGQYCFGDLMESRSLEQQEAIVAHKNIHHPPPIQVLYLFVKPTGGGGVDRLADIS